MTDPRLAATTVVVRDGHVLLLRRARTMAFAPGMHVFPGGAVENIDRGTTEIETLRNCAQRETLEEVGIDTRSHVVLFDRWVTPEFEPIRFDVGFFIATTADEGALLTSEADALMWITPREALDAAERGALPLLRPTWESLVRVRTWLSAGVEIAGLTDDVNVVPKLPRRNPRGSWDVVHATTGEVLEADVVGPQLEEATGMSVRT